jgi:hypothetical protein
MIIRLSLVAGLLVDVVIVALFALNLNFLWAMLLVSFGILIGLVTAPGNRKVPASLCALGLAAVPGFVLIRALPIHSLDWASFDGVGSATIEILANAAQVEVTDKVTLREFQNFARGGYYQTVMKARPAYVVVLNYKDGQERISVGRDWFADRADSSTQTIFVPKARGDFRRWLANIVKTRPNRSRALKACLTPLNTIVNGHDN